MLQNILKHCFSIDCYQIQAFYDTSCTTSYSLVNLNIKVYMGTRQCEWEKAMNATRSSSLLWKNTLLFSLVCTITLKLLLASLLITLDRRNTRWKGVFDFCASILGICFNHLSWQLLSRGSLAYCEDLVQELSKANKSSISAGLTGFTLHL